MTQETIIKKITSILDNIKKDYTINFLNDLYIISLEIKRQGYSVFYQEDIKKALEKKGIKVDKYDEINFIVKAK